jgi:hypothetical protein
MNILRTLILLSLGLTSCLFAVEDSNDPRLDPKLKEISSAIRSLVKKHYPKSHIAVYGRNIHFEWNTRTLVTGPESDFKNAGPINVPDEAGIIGTIELKDGKFRGSALVPQTISHKDHDLLLMAPYSQEADSHLIVELLCPRKGRDDNFISEFINIIDRFGVQENREQWDYKKEYRTK